MSPYDAYIKNQEIVEDKEELLLKTFEAIFSNLNIVKIAIEENIIEKKAQTVKKLIDTFEIMRASLDFEKGGEIAKNLDAIYVFCIEELVRANAKNDIEHIMNVVEVLTPIKEGFEEIAKQRVH